MSRVPGMDARGLGRPSWLVLPEEGDNDLAAFPAERARLMCEQIERCTST